MSRKSRNLKRQKLEAAKKLQELELLEKEAQKEESDIREKAKAEIEVICKEAGLFCGIVLSPEHLANVVQLAATTTDTTVSLPFNLYFKEEEEKETDKT